MCEVGEGGGVLGLPGVGAGVEGPGEEGGKLAA